VDAGPCEQLHQEKDLISWLVIHPWVNSSWLQYKYIKRGITSIRRLITSLITTTIILMNNTPCKIGLPTVRAHAQSTHTNLNNLWVKLYCPCM
jgi:hypothetical protein